MLRNQDKVCSIQWVDSLKAKTSMGHNSSSIIEITWTSNFRLFKSRLIIWVQVNKRERVWQESIKHRR